MLTQLLLLLPILFYAAAPQAAGATLQRATRLSANYNRPISIMVPFVFGVYFGWKGLNGLIKY